MRTPIRTFTTLAAMALLAAACAGAATTATPVVTQVPTVTPAPTATPAPAPTPIPTTDGVGPEYVTGTSPFTVTKDATQTVVGDVTQWRGQEMTGFGAMNDPRLAGTVHTTLDADLHGLVASEWGTSLIENAAGTWEGTWTGVSWNDGNATNVSGWLVGTGAYAGYTYYFHLWGPSEPFQAEGIIYQGSPPTP